MARRVDEKNNIFFNNKLAWDTKPCLTQRFQPGLQLKSFFSSVAYLNTGGKKNERLGL